tara:strand:+ start:4161 stop:4970 length:810 start_codon:yes stop_codon:yes gene_type:complete
VYVAIYATDKAFAFRYKSGMMSDWLKRALQESSLTQAELARLLSARLGRSIDRAAVNKMASGKRQIAADELLEIAQATGQPLPKELNSAGDPELRELTYHPDDEAAAVPADALYRPQIPGALPEIDVRPGAGHGQVGELGVIALSNGETAVGHRVIREWNLPDEFTKNHLEITQGRTFVLEVVGDSMLPTLLPGDRVIVDMSQRSFRADALYVIDDTFGEPQVKRLRRVPYSDEPTVEIISDNPNYGRDQIPAHRVRILGRVCGHMARK